MPGSPTPGTPQPLEGHRVGGGARHGLPARQPTQLPGPARGGSPARRGSPAPGAGESRPSSPAIATPASGSPPRRRSILRRASGAGPAVPSAVRSAADRLRKGRPGSPRPQPRPASDPSAITYAITSAQGHEVRLKYLTAAEVKQIQSAHQELGRLLDSGADLLWRIGNVLRIMRCDKDGVPSDDELVRMLSRGGYQPSTNSSVTLPQFLVLLDQVKGLQYHRRARETDLGEALAAITGAECGKSDSAGPPETVPLSALSAVCAEYQLPSFFADPPGTDGRATTSQSTPHSAPADEPLISVDELRLMLEESEELEAVLAFLALGATHPRHHDIAVRLRGLTDTASRLAAVQQVSDDLPEGSAWYAALAISVPRLAAHAMELGMDAEQAAGFAASMDRNRNGFVEFKEYLQFTRESQLQELRKRREIVGHMSPRLSLSTPRTAPQSEPPPAPGGAGGAQRRASQADQQAQQKQERPRSASPAAAATAAGGSGTDPARLLRMQHRLSARQELEARHGATAVSLYHKVTEALVRLHGRLRQSPLRPGGHGAKLGVWAMTAYAPDCRRRRGSISPRNKGPPPWLPTPAEHQQWRAARAAQAAGLMALAEGDQPSAGAAGSPGKSKNQGWGRMRNRFGRKKSASPQAGDPVSLFSLVKQLQHQAPEPDAWGDLEGSALTWGPSASELAHGGSDADTPYRGSPQYHYQHQQQQQQQPAALPHSGALCTPATPEESTVALRPQHQELPSPLSRAAPPPERTPAELSAERLAPPLAAAALTLAAMGTVHAEEEAVRAWLADCAAREAAEEEEEEVDTAEAAQATAERRQQLGAALARVAQGFRAGPFPLGEISRLSWRQAGHVAPPPAALDQRWLQQQQCDRDHRGKQRISPRRPTPGDAAGSPYRTPLRLRPEPPRSPRQYGQKQQLRVIRPLKLSPAAPLPSHPPPASPAAELRGLPAQPPPPMPHVALPAPHPPPAVPSPAPPELSSLPPEPVPPPPVPTADLMTAALLSRLSPAAGSRAGNVPDLSAFLSPPSPSARQRRVTLLNPPVRRRPWTARERGACRAAQHQCPSPRHHRPWQAAQPTLDVTPPKPPGLRLLPPRQPARSAGSGLHAALAAPPEWARCCTGWEPSATC